MPAPIVMAEVILDSIKGRLDLIVGAPDYNMSPTVQLGIPRDAMTEGVGEALYLEHESCELIHDAAGRDEVERATYHIWCVSRDTLSGRRFALRLARDAQKAIRSGFATLEAAGANAGVALGRYARDERAEQVMGATIYSFTLTADWIMDLAT